MKTFSNLTPAQKIAHLQFETKKVGFSWCGKKQGGLFFTAHETFEFILNNQCRGVFSDLKHFEVRAGEYLITGDELYSFAVNNNTNK
jgi:hypothetical protein